MVGNKPLITKTTNNPNNSSTINQKANFNIGLHPHISERKSRRAVGRR